MEEKNYFIFNLFRVFRLKKSMLAILLMSIFVFDGYASEGEIQTRVVKGTVTSEDGYPLPGVNIIIKGTTKGVLTDFDGGFTIDVVPADTFLLFSYTGYNDVEVPIGDNKTINVVMSPETNLDEVVIIAYGSAKKETLTGAVDQVKEEDFQDLAVTNPGLALQGKAPGLVVTRSSSRPGGEGLNFLIRGVSSVNGISPLVVIDGVPALNSNSFTDMNPNDIESVSVLKGGAASIYGARAAGGVILVTTKKGKGKVKVEASTIFRVGTIGIRPPTPTMQEYAKVYLDAASNDVNPYYFFWDQETLELMASGYEGIYENGILGNVYLGDAAIFDNMYGSSYSNQHNFSVSGASDTSHYRVSAGYDQNVGALKTTYDGAEKYNLAVNYGFDISEKLEINTNLTYFHKHFSGPQGGLGANALSFDAPLFPAKNPLGQWYGNFGQLGGGKNAIANTVDGGRTNYKDEQLRFILSADYKIFDDLNFTGSYSLTRRFRNYQRYVLTIPTYGWFGERANGTINPTSSIFEDKEESTYKNFKGAFNYKKSFGEHNFSGMLAIEAELTTSKNLEVTRDGFEDFGVYDLNLGSEEINVDTNGGAGTFGFYGYIGRINYDYKNKYLLELQGRRDGSSRFAEGYKWFNYGSVSAGWVLTQEEFLYGNDILTFLKLRGGYGELGSTSGVSTFGYLQGVGFNTTIFGQTAAEQTTATANGLFSTTTTWERIINKEVGVDFRLFKNKVFGSVDLFMKENVGMLIRGEYPETLGTNAPVTNLGNIETKGWEVVLGWRDRIGDLDLRISANMSDTRNELTDYTGTENIFVAGLNNVSDGEIRQGDPLNSFYMYKTDGFFADDAEVTDYYNTYTQESTGIIPSEFNTDTRLRPGDVKIVDTNGDNRIDTDDLVFQGDAAAHYVFGFNLDAEYKNWDLSAFFQGVLEQNVHRIGYLSYPFNRRFTNHTPAFLGRTWTEENPNAQYPRTTTNFVRAGWNYEYNDFMLQNSSYVRLKSLVIGYNIKNLSIGNTGIDNFRVYFSGNDLFELTTIDDGYDPESNTNTNSNLASYPFMRTWALGVKISI